MFHDIFSYAVTALRVTIMCHKRECLSLIDQFIRRFPPFALPLLSIPLLFDSSSMFCCFHIPSVCVCVWARGKKEKKNGIFFVAK